MYCQQCGKAIPAGARFCPVCGGAGDGETPTLVQQPPLPDAPPPKPSASNSNLAVLAAVLASIAMLIVAGVLWYASPNRSAETASNTRTTSNTTQTRAANTAPPRAPSTPTTSDAPSPQQTASGTNGGISQRIEFQRGRTSTIINGSVGSGSANTYLLRAQQGQRMLLHLTSSGGRARFGIYPQPGDPSSAIAEEADDWAGELPQSGDYAIRVYATTAAAVYTLEVTIR